MNAEWNNRDALADDPRVKKLARHEHGDGWMPKDAPWRDETAQLIRRLEDAGLVVLDPTTADTAGIDRP